MPSKNYPRKPYAPITPLIAARHASGFTRAQLAEILEITPRALSFYENGRETPSLSLVRRWVKALGKYGSMEFWRRDDIDDETAA
jgi:transcriptional regulator with XRE-family HTH domain